MKIIKGKFVVGLGSAFKIKAELTTHIGYDRSLDPNLWYIIDSHSRQIVGSYADKDLAIKLATFLDKADQKKLSDEIERILKS